jgi:hypothetical protein
MSVSIEVEVDLLGFGIVAGVETVDALLLLIPNLKQPPSSNHLPVFGDCRRPHRLCLAGLHLSGDPEGEAEGKRDIETFEGRYETVGNVRKLDAVSRGVTASWTPRLKLTGLIHVR